MLKNYLNSGLTFDESETNLEFKFRIINYILLIAGLFATLFGLLSDFGINDLGSILPKVNYSYSAICVLLIFLLRVDKTFFNTAATTLIVASLIDFTAALILVANDEFRLIWFYVAIYLSYVLLGSRAGVITTIASVITVIVCAILFDLMLSENALFTAAIGFVVASLLNRSHTIQMQTNVKRLDNALIKSQEASAAKSLFLANVSHEIRTPLNGMLGMVQVIRGTQLDEKQRHYLENFELSGKALQFLIDELLDLSKIESGTLALDLKPFNCFRWVMEIQMVTEPLFEKSPVAFTTETDEQLPSYLVGDSARLMQVAINLISNAAKFTAQGEVKLNISGTPANNGMFKLHLSVEDSGIGIPEDRLQDIFNCFHQLSENRIANKGVGLGLAISERLISAMGGKLSVSSTEGKGSRFWFEIELPVIAEEHLPVKTSECSECSQPFNVLLVDDDAINRLAASTLLKQVGHHVEMAIDGLDAIEKCVVAASISFLWISTCR